MGNDLPDYQIETQAATLEATSLKGGADAGKSANPSYLDIYLATDTQILYICCAAGSWTGFDAALLVQGTLTLYAAMAGGGFQINNIAAPTANQDAATKKYVDDLECDSGYSNPARVVDTDYQNTSGGARIVIISLEEDDGDQAEIRIGAASPAATMVARFYNDTGTNNLRVTLTAVVPNGYYYRLTEVAGNPVIDEWTEYDLDVA